MACMSCVLPAKLTVCCTIIWSFLTLTSCSEQASLEAFYFPRTEQVYRYESNGPDRITFWRFNTESPDFLTTTIFNASYQEQQKITERYLEGGVRIQKLQISMQDSTGLVKTTNAGITSSDIFPFVPLDSTYTYVYSVKWINPFDSAKSYDLIRNRRFFGYEKCDFKGEERKCVKMKLEQIVADIQEGALELKASGWEWYGEGIGLLKKEISFSEQVKLEQELTEILTIEEFKKQKQVYEGN